MSSLYKDAIADARKLKETAEQNAKNRIIEAVTPKLRQLIERQITEGGDGDLADDLDMGFLDSPDAMDLLDDEESEEVVGPEPMATMSDPVEVDTDGLASIEVVPDSDDSSVSKEYEDESQNKSVHVNITVESKNKLLRHRAIRLVKALSEAKTRVQRNKIRKELRILREALIITENSQNKRLANNLSVILKESNTMRRRRSNSWLFEDDDPEAGGEDLDLDLGPEDDSDASESGGSVDDMSLSDILAMAADKAEELEEGGSDSDDDDDADDSDDSDDLEDFDLEESDEVGDETYETMGESDELDQCESDEIGDEDDEVVEVNEAMLRRALRGTRRSRSSRRVNESRRRRIARARRRRRLAEGEAKAAASNFGGGKAGKDMFVDVDENTLLNALAEELGSSANSTASQGSAAKMAGHFGGGSVKAGAVMEARRHRRTKRQLVETKKAANKNARIARAAKAELKESNLFNAKLLYVTKLMQQHKLNNKQQRAIIEAMDNAKTQREAKLLFTSLNESLNKRSASKLNESKNLNESRTSYSNRSLQSGQAPRNNGVELDRWAVLAGIKK